jgi:hypothetical protein
MLAIAPDLKRRPLGHRFEATPHATVRAKGGHWLCGRTHRAILLLHLKVSTGVVTHPLLGGNNQLSSGIAVKQELLPRKEHPLP